MTQRVKLTIGVPLKRRVLYLICNIDFDRQSRVANKLSGMRSRKTNFPLTIADIRNFWWQVYPTNQAARWSRLVPPLRVRSKQTATWRIHVTGVSVESVTVLTGAVVVVTAENIIKALKSFTLNVQCIFVWSPWSYEALTFLHFLFKCQM